MNIEFEKIILSDKKSSFSWMINPKLNDFYFWHFHPEFEVVYIEALEGTRHVGDHISKFQDSDLVLIGSNIPHLNFDYGIKTEYKKTVLHISPDFLAYELEHTPELIDFTPLFEKMKYGVAFGKETQKEVKDLFLSAHQLSYFDQYVCILRVFKILVEAQDFSLLHQRKIANQINQKEVNRLKNIYAFIDENYKRKIDISAIAEISNLSNSAFCRYFKKITKLTFIEFLNHYRINQAKRLLTLDKNVSETSFECGFESLSYFNRTFKKITGENPSNFKKRV